MNMTTENTMRTTTPSTLRLLTPGVWHVDPDHSEVTFRVKAMWGLITVSGRFKALDGTIHVRESMAFRGRLRAHAISLDTGIRIRDGHLRSADFFDAEHHPYLEFSVQKLADGGDGRVRIAGDLVIRGIASPLEVEAVVRDAGDGTIETAAQAVVERAAIGRSLKRGGVIKGPAHLAARIRFVRDGDTRTKTDDRRG
jgi:polyisoprenoid-binding protein YceI